MPKFQVRMTKIVHDVVQTFVVVEADDTEAAQLAAIEQAGEAEWAWKDCCQGDEDLETHEITLIAE